VQAVLPDAGQELASAARQPALQPTPQSELAQQQVAELERPEFSALELRQPEAARVRPEPQ